MGKSYTIYRQMIFLFLKDYHYFTSAPAFLAFPFAISILVSQSFIASSYAFRSVQGRLESIFLAAGFPLSSELFNIINLRISQIIVTFMFVSPFTYSFLLLAKASVIKNLTRDTEKSSSFYSYSSLYKPLLISQLCNMSIMLSANASCFFIFLIFFSFFDFLGLSSDTTLTVVSYLGLILYSIVLANTYITCHLSLIVSGFEETGGFISILKAWLLIRGRTVTALSLALPINVAFAGVEALFQYRIFLRVYQRTSTMDGAVIMEGMFIAYLYGILLILDTIIGCVFWRSCRKDYQINQDDDKHMFSSQEKLLP